MSVSAFVCFTVVVLLGGVLATGVFRGTAASRAVQIGHGGLAVLGLALVVAILVRGDTRFGVCLALGVVVTVFGGAIAVIRSKRINPSALVACHIGLAAMFYLILAFFTFGPSF